jgi:threonine dehydratase
MWHNKNNSKKNIIALEEFNDANDIIKNNIIETPLFKLEKISDEINNIVYLKDESKQITNSFKIRGVYYVVYKEIQNITMENTYMITQSTGNHGIAFLFSLYQLMKLNINNKIITSIIPIIFTSKDIQNVKLNLMIYYLNEIRILLNKSTYGEIRATYDTYEDALNARLDFIKKNNAIYIAHGSKDTIIGHGTMGIEIMNQLNILGYDSDTKITFLAACGAGGPLGIGICLKQLYNNVNFVIVQTDDQDALIRSLKEDKIIKNKHINPELPFNFADGIGVDTPEKEAFELCKNYADYGISVSHKECFLEATKLNLDIKKSNNETTFSGGTSVAVYLAINKLKNYDFIKNSDLIIMLSCEGNIDDIVKDYIKNIS